MKRLLLEKGHLLAVLLAVALLAVAFLPHYRLTVRCDEEITVGEYGVGVIWQLIRAGNGISDESAQPLVMAEGLLDSISASQEGLFVQTLWPLAATGVLLIAGAILLVLAVADACRNRLGRRLRNCAALLIILQFAISILLYLAVSSLSGALAGVNAMQLFGLQTVEVRLSVAYGFGVALIGEILLLLVAVLLPKSRAKAPQAELRPIL